MKTMGKKYLKAVVSAVLLVVAGCHLARAQSENDVLRYSLQYPEGDPVSMIMPATSYAAGFGSYQQNPASAAFFKRSFVSIGASDRYVNEKGMYIRNTSNYSDNQFNVGDVGFVYKAPTSRGKFVFGAGYSQSHDYNRALSGHGYNNITTITDFWASSFSSNALNQAAFDAYTINDQDDNNGQPLYSYSIFRDANGGSYQGIEQNFNLTERGTLGEFSAFLGVELAKNFEVGASIGVISGGYQYKRHFLESDTKNVYDAAIIKTDDGYTDVDHILSKDAFHDTFTGFSARLGFIYQVTPHFNIGAAYQFKNVLHINEDFGTHIRNTLDNGDFFTGKDLGKFKYKTVRPGRLNLGITAKNISGFTISASAQRVAYSRSRIEFDDLQDQSVQDQINGNIESDLNDVFNLRIGLAYQVNNQFTPRIGYGHYPSPTKLVDAARNFYSAGFSARLSRSATFNAAAQLGMWKDRDALYTTPKGIEAAKENVKHWNIMAGFTFYF
jgi:hypothetical protein